MLPSGTRVLPTFTITAATPAAQTFTTSAAVTLNATTIPVTSIPITVLTGTVLTFGATAVTVTADALQTASAGNLTVAPVSAAIASAATANYTPAANAISNTQVFVSPIAIGLDAGEVLNFGGTSVVLTRSAPVNSRALFCRPLTAAVANAATASTIALVTIVGATDATPVSSPKTTDTTNYVSGSGVEMAVIGTNRTLNVSYNQIEEDPGGLILNQILFNNAYFDREIYAQITRSTGERFEGAAIATTGDGQGPVQEKVTRTVQMQFQGDSFIYTPSTKDTALLAAASLLT